jgi:hypothetical protein
MLYFCSPQMVVVAQLVRASDCDSEGRGFEPPQLPQKPLNILSGFFIKISFKNTFAAKKNSALYRSSFLRLFYYQFFIGKCH